MIFSAGLEIRIETPAETLHSTLPSFLPACLGVARMDACVSVCRVKRRACDSVFPVSGLQIDGCLHELSKLWLTRRKGGETLQKHVTQPVTQPVASSASRSPSHLVVRSVTVPTSSELTEKRPANMPPKVQMLPDLETHLPFLQSYVCIRIIIVMCVCVCALHV